MCVPGVRQDWIAKITQSAAALFSNLMQLEELTEGFSNTALLQRIQELQQEVANLRELLKVKTTLEAPPQNSWDKVAKNLYKALT
jgi:hypothetical protein